MNGLSHFWHARGSRGARSSSSHPSSDSSSHPSSDSSPHPSSDRLLHHGKLNRVGWLICCSLLWFPIIAVADHGLADYHLEAYRTFQSIEIDGDFSESDWQKAKPINQLVQIEPNEGEAATQSTEVRVLYDDQNIYFAFTCFDSDISKLVANEMRRDGRDIHENDNVFVLLDTYNDKRSGFFFRINALGAKQDSAVTNNGDSLNRDWDAVWSCRSKVNDTHWTTEIAIPFSQLRFKKSEEMKWGVNVGREIARNQEESIWTPVSKIYGGMAKYRTANLGHLVGLSGITPSRNLEILPYFLPGISQTNEEGKTETHREFELGFDAKYGITPNLTADLTFNTDFAQVEADQQRVNLTRFSLFFPEKRPFFLEGAGMFDFGIPRTSFRRPPPLLLFYSRRIGIAEERAVPILTGGKVSGKMGPYSVGLLNVLTDEIELDESETEPRTNYTVLRLKRDVFKGSSVGLIAINKQDTEAYNRATGFDFAYRPTEQIDIRGMWAHTFESEDGWTDESRAYGLEENLDHTTAGQNALYFGGRWRNELFRLEGSFMDIGEAFNPTVGFVQRTGVRHIRNEMRYTPWPNRFGIRRIWMGPEFDFVLNQENKLVTRTISYINWFELGNGGWVSFGGRRRFEYLDEDFEPHDGIVIPIGEYHFTTFRCSISSDDTKKLSGRLSGNIGEFFNGKSWGFDIDASFKPTERLSIEPEYEFNRVTLPSSEDGWEDELRAFDAFNTNAFSARVNYSFSTRLFAKLFAQWNSEQEEISSNFLVNYIYRPGSNFFLVFNQRYETGGNTTELVDTTLVSKITYWWNP